MSSTTTLKRHRGPASLREIEQQPCPGYRDPFTGKLHHREGQTHRLSNSRRGVRCVCDQDEPTLRGQAEAARSSSCKRPTADGNVDDLTAAKG